MFAVQTTSKSTGCALLLLPFEKPKRKRHERVARRMTLSGPCVGGFAVFSSQNEKSTGNSMRPKTKLSRGMCGKRLVGRSRQSNALGKCASLRLYGVVAIAFERALTLGGINTSLFLHIIFSLLSHIWVFCFFKMLEKRTRCLRLSALLSKTIQQLTTCLCLAFPS